MYNIDIKRLMIMIDRGCRAVIDQRLTFLLFLLKDGDTYFLILDFSSKKKTKNALERLLILIDMRLGAFKSQMIKKNFFFLLIAVNKKDDFLEELRLGNFGIFHGSSWGCYMKRLFSWYYYKSVAKKTKFVNFERLQCFSYIPWVKDTFVKRIRLFVFFFRKNKQTNHDINADILQEATSWSFHLFSNVLNVSCLTGFDRVRNFFLGVKD